MLKSAVIPVIAHGGITVPNQLLYHEPGSGKLLVLLPGLRYSCDRSVLHLIRAMALQHGFDVLSLQYGFQSGGQRPTDEELLAEITAAFTAVMGRGYGEVCFVGKSMGSPLAMALTRAAQVPHVSAILLTPLPEVLGPVDGIRALAIIGTADPVYAMPECRDSRQRADMEWLVLEDLDHGLEVNGDWRRSIAALPQIIAACERFLTPSA